MIPPVRARAVSASSSRTRPCPNLGFDQPGRLAYANAGRIPTAHSFSSPRGPYPSLNGNYTIFGQCDAASVELVKKIARRPRNGNDRPNTNVVIKHIKIDEGGTAKAPVKKTVDYSSKGCAG